MIWCIQWSEFKPIKHFTSTSQNVFTSLNPRAVSYFLFSPWQLVRITKHKAFYSVRNQRCCNMSSSRLHTRGTALLETWVSSRFSVKCTPRAISGLSAPTQFLKEKPGLQERTTLKHWKSLCKPKIVTPGYQVDRFMRATLVEKFPKIQRNWDSNIENALSLKTHYRCDKSIK